MKKIITILVIFYLNIFIISCNIFESSSENSNLVNVEHIIPKSFDSNNIASINTTNINYSIPIILHNNNVRFRKAPSFNADVVSIGKSGISVNLIKRTENKDFDAIGNAYYWYYAYANGFSYEFGKQVGWVFGKDIFPDHYNYLYNNKLEIISYPTNFDISNSSISTDFKIDKPEVKVMYKPTLYSSPVYILYEGDTINLLEKTAFINNIYEHNDGSYIMDNFVGGRWFYIKHHNSHQIINGWIFENYLPNNITENIKSDIPYNYAYRPETKKPLYIGKTIIEENNKNAYIHLMAQIDERGIVIDLPLNYGYFRNTSNISNGYVRWAYSNVKGDKYYLYHNGKEVGYIIPMDDDIPNLYRNVINNNAVSIKGKLYLNEDFKDHTGELLTFSANMYYDNVPIKLNSYNIDKNDSKIIKLKEQIEEILYKNFRYEFNIDIKSDGFSIKKLIDIVPVTYDNADNYYLYIIDARIFINSNNNSNYDTHFVFKQIGLINNLDNDNIIIENIIKRVPYIEIDFLKSYKGILGTVDFDRDGNDEIILELEDINNNKSLKIISPLKDSYITIYE